jgi:prolyl-tRNA editing enzyme YbaK/EbsC (Cys-tRNA(Pro) deacylase)
VQERLRVRGLEVEVRTLDESTRSAAEAAAAIGCEEGQIVKSLVFMTDDGPLVCLCAGDRRVDPARLRAPARRAPTRSARRPGSRSAASRRSATSANWSTIVDASLRRFERVWAAAGTPRSVFEVGTEELIAALAGAEVCDLAG